MFKFSVPEGLRLSGRLWEALRMCRDGVPANDASARMGLTPFKRGVHGITSAEVVPATGDTVARWKLRVAAEGSEPEEFLLHGVGNEDRPLVSSRAAELLEEELRLEPGRREDYAKAEEAKSAARTRAAEAVAATELAFAEARAQEERVRDRSKRFSKPFQPPAWMGRPRRRRPSFKEARA